MIKHCYQTLMLNKRNMKMCHTFIQAVQNVLEVIREGQGQFILKLELVLLNQIQKSKCTTSGWP